MRIYIHSLWKEKLIRTSLCFLLVYVWFGDELEWDGSIPGFGHEIVPSHCLVRRIDLSLFFVWYELQKWMETDANLTV